MDSKDTFPSYPIISFAACLMLFIHSTNMLKDEKKARLARVFEDKEVAYKEVPEVGKSWVPSGDLRESEGGWRTASKGSRRGGQRGGQGPGY